MDTESRLEHVERQLRALRVALVAVASEWVVLAGLWIASGAGVASAGAENRSLRLRELVIVHDQGVERARLGSNLPTGGHAVDLRADSTGALRILRLRVIDGPAGPDSTRTSRWSVASRLFG